MAWKCKECSCEVFEDCSPYYVSCWDCNNSGNYIEDIAEWEDDNDND